jgi:nucleoside 2-deoxyribosyltransferase
MVSSSIKLVTYLAGPIQGCSDNEAMDWREYVKENVNDEVFCLDPMIRDYRGKEGDPELIHQIIENDKKDIDDSDVVFVYLAPLFFERASVGTSMEIIYGHDKAKYVIIVDESGKDILSPWLVYHSDEILSSLNEGVDRLNELTKTFNVEQVAVWPEDEGVQ